MAAILDLVNFHRFKELQKTAIPFFLITIMFQKGINEKNTFNKHFARKYIRAYTNWLMIMMMPRLKATRSDRTHFKQYF